jgi:hypothetical protein
MAIHKSSIPNGCLETCLALHRNSTDKSDKAGKTAETTKRPTVIKEGWLTVLMVAADKSFPQALRGRALEQNEGSELGVGLLGELKLWLFSRAAHCR